MILVSTGFWKLSCRWIQSGVVTRTLCQISTHFKVIRSRGSRKLSRTREQSSPPGPSPSLGWHQYLKRRLRNRWEAVLQKARYEQPDTGRSPHFREAHVRTLMEQNCRRHLGTEEDTPLAADAFSEACTQLKESIDGQAAMASFVCGGSIAVGNSAVVDVMTSPPVSIFWATRHDSAARKLVLPLNNSAPESSHDVLRQLVADCEPATFGRGDQDVLDPEYRKAGKIDPHQFVTSFHPARFGIIENIEQILLPSVSTEIEDRLQFRRITPELYKLNVRRLPC